MSEPTPQHSKWVRMTEPELRTLVEQLEELVAAANLRADQAEEHADRLGARVDQLQAEVDTLNFKAKAASPALCFQRALEAVCALDREDNRFKQSLYADCEQAIQRLIDSTKPADTLLCSD